MPPPPRRRFLKVAALGAAAGAASIVQAPAIARTRYRWRVLSVWPSPLSLSNNGLVRFTQRVSDLSDGRMEIDIVEPPPDAPAPGSVLDAVSSGEIEMGHGISSSDVGRHPQFAFFTGIPFGLLATEHAAWIRFGGGQALWDELCGRFGAKPFLAGNTGPQMLGWYRREIHSADDFRGLRLRPSASSREVLRRLGAQIVEMAPGDILAALENGTLDGAEWSAPYSDVVLGLDKSAAYYCGPGFQQGSRALSLLANKNQFDALPPDLQVIVETAARAANDDITAEYALRNAEAVNRLVARNVKLSRLPNEVMIAIGNTASEILAEQRDAADELGKRIFDSFLKSRQWLLTYARLGEQAFSNARSLSFRYVD